MASNLTVMGNKEILLVAENIAHEKGISPQEIVQAMEEGIKAAAKKKYGHNLAIECVIDKKTGQIKLFNALKVVKDDDKDIVIGKGNLNADILFVGEAPGKNEDEQGLPFVGRAGKNLDALLTKVGLSLGDVYIVNILKCRPVGS